jgi:indolepyruvate ferredoxin oxidoreductase alpha subunit
LEFEYSVDMVEDVVRDYTGRRRRERISVTVPELPPRPPVLCPGCPHRAGFYVVRKVFGKQTVYCNDIGCYTLGYGEPLESCDLLLCMGSSITQASGIARVTGRRTVAYIGDSTFFHSGLPALANAVQAGDQITIIVLDNYTTAMTGFQPSLTTSNRPGPDGVPGGASGRAKEAGPLSIEEAVRGLGVEHLFSIDPFDVETAVAAVKQAKAAHGVSVVVSHAWCAVELRRARKGKAVPPLTIDQDRCEDCSLCIRVLGCPAILVTDRQHTIDQDLCIGCGLCAYVCQQGAIEAPITARK